MESASVSEGERERQRANYYSENESVDKRAGDSLIGPGAAVTTRSLSAGLPRSHAPPRGPRRDTFSVLSTTRRTQSPLSRSLSRNYRARSLARSHFSDAAVITAGHAAGRDSLSAPRQNQYMRAAELGRRRYPTGPLAYQTHSRTFASWSGALSDADRLCVMLIAAFAPFIDEMHQEHV